MAFSWKNGVAGQCGLLTLQKFKELMRDAKTRYNVERHRYYLENPDGLPKEEADSLAERHKKLLPAAIWQAYFPGGQNHNDAELEASGFFGLDVDDVEDARKLAMEVLEHKDELDIVHIQISPGGYGIHIVAMCQPDFTTIEENQKWLAGKLNIEYDAVCKNWSRLWFISTEEDMVYLNEEMFM